MCVKKRKPSLNDPACVKASLTPVKKDVLMLNSHMTYDIDGNEMCLRHSYFECFFSHLLSVIWLEFTLVSRMVRVCFQVHVLPSSMFLHSSVFRPILCVHNLYKWDLWCFMHQGRWRLSAWHVSQNNWLQTAAWDEYSDMVCGVLMCPFNMITGWTLLIIKEKVPVRFRRAIQLQCSYFLFFFYCRSTKWTKLWRF